MMIHKFTEPSGIGINESTSVSRSYAATTNNDDTVLGSPALKYSSLDYAEVVSRYPVENISLVGAFPWGIDEPRRASAIA
jgi:hypothetical protein